MPCGQGTGRLLCSCGQQESLSCESEQDKAHCAQMMDAIIATSANALPASLTIFSILARTSIQ
jgi:hypothetical protein